MPSFIRHQNIIEDLQPHLRLRLRHEFDITLNGSIKTNKFQHGNTHCVPTYLHAFDERVCELAGAVTIEEAHF